MLAFSAKKFILMSSEVRVIRGLAVKVRLTAKRRKKLPKSPLPRFASYDILK